MDDGDIHIAPGDAAAECLRAGLGLAPDRMLIHHDLLACGPLPPIESMEQWRRVREGYLQTLDPEDASCAFEGQPRDLFTNRERLRTATRITLWVGTGLGEQLLLLWTVALLRHLAVDRTICRIIQFGYEGRNEIVCVGVLNPAQVRGHPTPIGLDEPSERMAAEAWNAITSPEPGALLAFLDKRERTLPFLHRALGGLLYHYPNVRTGVNAFEYQLLQCTRDEGPRTTRVIGYTMGHDFEFPEWKADSYLFARLHRMAHAALPRPLVTLSGDVKSMRTTEVRLTEHGEAILDSKGNAVHWNGLDDWVGGVHLDSRQGRLWFQDGDRLVAGSD